MLSIVAPWLVGRCESPARRSGSIPTFELHGIDDTGRDLDDLKPVIDSFDFLTEVDRLALYEGNARQVFKLPVTA